MTDPSTPPALATALAHRQAWTSQNLEQAMIYIADDISCDAPGAQISGHSSTEASSVGFMAQLTAGRSWLGTVKAARSDPSQSGKERKEMQAQYFVAFFQTRYASLAEVREEAPDDLAAHIARSKQWHEEGRLLMAGAFLDRPEEPVSTMAVLASHEDAEEYVAGDPFVVKGMVASSKIRPWANMLAS